MYITYSSLWHIFLTASCRGAWHLAPSSPRGRCLPAGPRRAAACCSRPGPDSGRWRHSACRCGLCVGERGGGGGQRVRSREKEGERGRGRGRGRGRETKFVCITPTPKPTSLLLRHVNDAAVYNQRGGVDPLRVDQLALDGQGVHVHYHHLACRAEGKGRG